MPAVSSPDPSSTTRTSQSQGCRPRYSHNVASVAASRRSSLNAGTTIESVSGSAGAIDVSLSGGVEYSRQAPRTPRRVRA
jgi:hypothetical protein